MLAAPSSSSLTALAAAALAVAALATGCADDGPACPGAMVGIREPVGLVCQQRKPPSEECPGIPALPPWPRCGNECEKIRDAGTCAASAGCRIAWLDCTIFPDECDHPGGFVGCYGVLGEPAPVGACSAITDAVACATRDDCAGFYIKGPTCPGGDPFEAARQPDGEACLFSYMMCVDELSPPT